MERKSKTKMAAKTPRPPRKIKTLFLALKP
jgi:hypothetical protein